MPTPYTQLSTLPYLQACISEALRIHPVVGHILERVVPPSGLTLSDGTTLPPGTIIGMNPWVIHHDEAVFGIDGCTTEDFVPERWFQGEFENREAYESRIAGMRDCDMSFGNGNRVCLGRAIALVEMAKFVAALFSGYKASFSFLRFSSLCYVVHA